MFHELGNLFHRLYFVVERLETSDADVTESAGPGAAGKLDRERMQVVAELRPEIDRLHQFLREGLEFLRVPAITPISLSVADLLRSLRGLVASAMRAGEDGEVDRSRNTDCGLGGVVIEELPARVGSRLVSLDATQFQTGVRLVLAQLLREGGASVEGRSPIVIDVSCPAADALQILLRSTVAPRADRAPAAARLQWALAEHHLRATDVGLECGFGDRGFSPNDEELDGAHRVPRECLLRLTLAPEPGVG